MQDEILANMGFGVTAAGGALPCREGLSWRGLAQ